MRSSGPIPGNPWPQDMVITVEDDSNALIDLLWIREAWDFRPTGDDLPPRLSDVSVGAHARTESSDLIARWQAAWPSMWDACVHHSGVIQDGSAMFDRLQETADGSPERARLLTTLMGPSWRSEFGDEVFDDRYDLWNLARFEAESPRSTIPLDEQPERVSLTALIRAWRAGLAKIVTIPCQGSYTRVIGRHALLVTAETRGDPRRYSEALGQFR
jgi:hypothetical protein